MRICFINEVLKKCEGKEYDWYVKFVFTTNVHICSLH